MRTLVIEDEPKIASFLSKGLREEGYAVEVACDLATARRALEEADFELLIVDRMLPDGDGMSLVRSLREAGSDVAAICLTARAGTDDKVEALHSGADDYLVKPFAFDELLARIVAVCRRTGRVSERVEVGDLVLDVAAHRAWRGGRELDLTKTEFSLLRTLATSLGRVLSRSQLLSRVWGLSYDPGTNIVDVYVSYVRAKLDRDGDRPLIHTVRGVGYVLDPDR